MKDLLNDLNDKQKDAVTAPLGPVLVLAGAGSGKTRALTYRIAYLIREKVISPQNVLAVTFTNKAASEMKDRVQKLLGRGSAASNNVTMGTFHSICVRILRADIDSLKIGMDRNFSIFDSDDSKRLLKQIVLELDLDKEFHPRMFGYYISNAKNKLIEPRGLAIDKDYLARTVQQVYEIYQARLRAQNAVDFDDLLELTVKLLQQDQKILSKYQEKFQYILVDEYQDTNHAQYVMLKLLAARNQNIFVVGDDAQSIYGFRGANMQNILDFSKDYPEAKVVMLEQNYRSTQNILNTANKVIGINKSQYEKDLWTENDEGKKVSLFEAVDEVEESDHVVKNLIGESEAYEEEPEYIEDQAASSILDKFKRPNWVVRSENMRRRVSFADLPSDLSETAILYRTHAQSRAFEEAMMNAGIPYQIVGGIRFYERREIKDALSYMRLVLNPRDLVSFSRVINLPARGIGAQSFKLVKQALEKYDYDFKRVLNNIDDLELSAKALSGARDFFTFLKKASALTDKKNIMNLIDLLLKGAGYKDYLLDGSEEGANRWENVEELLNVAAKYKKSPWREGLQKFLEEIALMTDLDQMEETGNKLTMMTLHSAKGLEFEKVFLVGLEEGLLPHSRSLLNPEEIAEEVRLAYVGMTRARKELYLSFARSRQVFGELKRSVPSRVLKAIPKRLLRRLN